MTLRDEIRKLLQFVGTTPTRVELPQHNAKKIQIAVAHVGNSQFRTVDCNGTVYAWRIQ